MITTAPRPVTQFGMANRSPMHQAATTENTEGTEHGRRSLTVPLRGTAEVPQGKGFRSDSVVSLASVVNILRLRSVSDRSRPQDLDAANKTVEYLARCVRGVRRALRFSTEAAPSAQDIVERRAARPSILKQEGSRHGL